MAHEHRRSIQSVWHMYRALDTVHNVLWRCHKFAGLTLLAYVYPMETVSWSFHIFRRIKYNNVNVLYGIPSTYFFTSCIYYYGWNTIHSVYCVSTIDKADEERHCSTNNSYISYNLIGCLGRWTLCRQCLWQCHWSRGLNSAHGRNIC